MIITLGMPLVGDLDGDALESHLRMVFQLGRKAEQLGHKVWISCPLNTMPHDRARVAVLDEACRFESDYIYFVDTDTLVPPEAFEELLRVQQETQAVLVSGHYYRRGFPFTCVWSKIINGEFHQVTAEDGLHEIDTTGFGCALIDLKWVLKNLKPPFFTMEQGKTSSIVTDDVSFCIKVREAGGLILGHGGIRCIHLGGRIGVCDETASFLQTEYFRTKHKKGVPDGLESHGSTTLSVD